jgi:hypothetical protein
VEAGLTLDERSYRIAGSEEEARMMHRFASALVCVALAGGALACDQIKMQGVVRTTVTKGGKTTTKERHFTKLSELPAALEEAGQDLGEVTAELKKVLIDAPPPGQVKLGALVPALQKYEGSKTLDFLVAGKDADGKPVDFSYVQIGVPTYDDFFKTSMEMYALTFQAQQSLARTREVCAAIVGDDKPKESESLASYLKRAHAVDKTDDNGDLFAMLDDLESMDGALGANVTALAGKTKDLVLAGQRLITGAPASITNPKTALHLKLIVEGLKKSVSVVSQSGDLLGKIAGDMT